MDLSHLISQDKAHENKAAGEGAPVHLLGETKSKSPAGAEHGMSGHTPQKGGGGSGSSSPGGNTGGSKQQQSGGGGSDSGGPLDMDFPDRNGQHHPIAEFLYQLTKMLTDDNSEIIEWADGRIKVHHPERLEAEVLHRYFRHSKFASFQRQLNYFGFRKMAGKGKMSPCSYVNEAASADIRSLLLIKRKTNGSAARKAALEQRAAALANPMGNAGLLGMNFLTAAANPGAAGTAGAAGIGGMGAGNLSSAMALLSENALRAGLGQLPGLPGPGNQQSLSNTQLSLLALQQQQQQIQQQIQQQQQSEQLKQLVQQQQQQNQFASLQQQQQQNSGQGAQPDESTSGSGAKGNNKDGSKPSEIPSLNMNNAASLEQLHAQLAAQLAQHQSKQQNQHQQQQSDAATALASMNFGNMPATAALKFAAGGGADSNPATAALQAQQGAGAGSSNPATAAMNAASQSANQQQSNSLFESAINLKSLLQEHQEQAAAAQQQQQQQQNPQELLRNRLPSQSAIFPNSTSLGNLLGSSNRLNSLLSLNSFMGSREASLADFAAMNNNLTAQLQQQQQQLSQQQAQMAAAANAQALQAEAARLRNQ